MTLQTEKMSMNEPKKGKSFHFILHPFVHTEILMPILIDNISFSAKNWLAAVGSIFPENSKMSKLLEARVISPHLFHSSFGLPSHITNKEISDFNECGKQKYDLDFNLSFSMAGL